jgi:hypothetical protein
VSHKTCWRCNQPYITKVHSTPEDCIRSLQRRNVRDREQVGRLATNVGELAHEVFRLSQRVEMVAVFPGEKKH